ncbi:hypothetical protein ILUMI_27227 [Ignelater luminosus]|uniref:C2H2-type domain-containing protein n=1 Tax=Ignelater luminosus TaxID=2038154 RepID=A0A8K0FYD8_IGNLU|nr:hypothetical protein ILUMI_27227 [Ignelater luminosus]
MCDVCSRPFNRKKSLIQHLRTHSNEKPFACPNCEWTFKSKFELNKHSSVHNEKNAFLCDKCPRTSNKESTSQEAKVLWVSLSELLYEDLTSGSWKCRLCSTALEKDFFREHILTHTKQKAEEASEKFKCEKCSKHFSSLRSLREHSVLHEKRLRFCCPMCDKGFPRKDYLKRHISSKHENTFYTCHVCNKSFKDYAYYRGHIRMHVGIRYECSDCKRIFGYRSALVRHVKTHKSSTSG